MAYQTGLIPLGSKDLLTQLKFNQSGHLLAATSLDHSIRLSQRSTSEGGWSDYAFELKAHDAPVLALAWAPPEWGKIIATGSSDGTIKVWAIKTVSESNAFKSPHAAPVNTPARLQLVCSIADARGTVRDLAFSPATLGLKLAVISSDSKLKVYECVDPVKLTDWSSVNEVDIGSLPNSPSSGASTAGAGLGLGSLANGGKQSDAGSSAQAASTTGGSSSASGSSLEGRKGGSVESEGGWALSWCGEGWWGERLAVSAGANGVIRLFHLPAHNVWHNFLVLGPARSQTQSAPITSQTVVNHAPPTTSIAWAPASGRSYQLLAAGSKNGKAQVWRVQPAALEGEEGPAEWTATLDGELASSDNVATGSGQPAQAQGATVVEWNLTGTVLSTTAVGGGVRLWKSVYAGPWKALAKISTDEGDDGAMQM